MKHADLDGVVGRFRIGERGQAEHQPGGRRQPATAAQRRNIVSQLS
jgi:hypothetical protein